jgi:hypothetical protein
VVVKLVFAVCKVYWKSSGEVEFGGAVADRGTSMIWAAQTNSFVLRFPREKSARCTSGRCRMHGGLSPGAPKGNQNALKDGRYASSTVKRRREIAMLIRLARSLSSS